MRGATRLLFWRRRQHDPRRCASSKKPFPVQQMAVLALCRICEPIAFMSIFPYVYYMIKSFGIASSDQQIAVFAGMVTSAFAFAEFSTAVIWGRVSDVVGRKPVLILGLFGTGISMILFGFARNLPLAMLARALGGLLNGNMGVLQTTVAELVPDESQRPMAYSIMPSIWCLGGIVGASLGGALSDPVNNLNFGRGTILETFPYLLPNLVCLQVVLFSTVIGILFIEETHEKKKHQRDRGLEAGKWILRKLGLSSASSKYEEPPASLEKASAEETVSLINDGSPFPSAETTPRTSQETFAKHVLDAEAARPVKSLTLGKVLTPQIIMAVSSVGILAYHTITFDQLLPVLLSMDRSDEKPSLPFKFTGGFQLPSTTIGFILSLQGIYQMAAQVFLFPFLVKRLGTVRTFRLCALTWPLLYFTVPYLTILSERWRMPALFAILIWKVTLTSLAYPSSGLILTNNAASTLVLGMINGCSASAASLARAVGPTMSGLIQTAGLQRGYAGIPWWATAGIAALGGVLSLFLRDMKSFKPRNQGASEQAPQSDGPLPTGDDEEAERRLSDISEATLVEPKEPAVFPKS